MAFPIAWAVGSFIGGLLAKEFYDDVIAEHDDDCEEKAGYSDEMLTALYKKLTNAGDAQGFYDFGCILENENEDWARKFFKAAADMDFMVAQQKLRTMDQD